MSTRPMIVVGLAVALAACSVKPVTFTPDDGVLPDGGVVVPDTGGPPEDCGVPGDEDGNRLADCDDPACAGAPSCQSSPGPACGNTRVETGEECDDGNDRNGDSCENDCTLPRCGNDIPDTGEQCDHGPSNGGVEDSCSVTCHIVACGNGFVEQGEQCDDGPVSNGPHLRCNAVCKLNVCGDGDVLTDVEECDDANTNPNDGCDACKLRAPQVDYDVAYVDEMTISAGGYGAIAPLVVINTGTQPLDLGTVTVVGAPYDHTEMQWTFQLIDPHPQILLMPGRAAGYDAEPLITSSGLVTEPFDDRSLLFASNGNNIPQVVFDLNAQIKIDIQGRPIVLPLVIHFVPQGTGSIRFTRARRLHAP